MKTTRYLLFIRLLDTENVLDSCYGKDFLRIFFLVFNKLHSGKLFSFGETKRHW